jgi:hypothetical protein
MIVLKTILKYLVGFFLLIQLIQVDYEVPPVADPSLEIKAPAEIMAVFKRSCYDCHSNSVILPWYSHIAPLSWTMDRHIDLGRKWLNFSTWENYTEKQKDEKMAGIYRTVYIAMPLRSYVFAHPEADLTQSERKMIREWTGKAPF